jgi:16S rRNA (cytidine1402-2'-O)-methyltransferase
VNEKSGTLYIVATPIGNLGDITLRALEILKSVDVIAAEDTRHTIKLLNHYGIKTKLISHHEHNEDESAKGIVNLLEQGTEVALVTDAGMPCISDPGYKLISLARSMGHNVTCLPGASAVPAAVALSGLDAGRYRFEGFLPNKASQRKGLLEDIARDGCAVVIYEAPHRLKKTVGQLAEIFHDRKIALVNDISKIHERAEAYEAGEIMEALDGWVAKGEFVIVIEKGAKRPDTDYMRMSVKEHVADIMEREHIKKMDAVKKAARLRGIPKSEVYRETLDL